MQVLIATASRHGSTREIAACLGERLAGHGLRVVVADAEVVTDLDGYDAVVLGSAVYAGRWVEAARLLVARLGDELAERPLWLFSSGPVGDPPRPLETAQEPRDLLDRFGAREHRVFAGKLDRSVMSVGERALARVVRAPEGDFRDWAAIAAWADEISTQLAAAPTV
ncbi:flavodoxin domain-containing protein [Egicoccus halophilus]|uniref:Flavodoxin n=1 Tax=Egicoccus halophilus TaxID=1670830 RepID=A0A8J3ADQ9_9ACTN|nr:flavodoxin domain-containing protein [Egicoccus halophilus]GGI05512.1 flavodoxin [Egicoccus halophilus]